jgi:DNA-binding NarL/FixJ family response regulator
VDGVVRVLLIEDDELVLLGLAQMLFEAARAELVGSATSYPRGAFLLQVLKARGHNPDILLLGSNLAVEVGIDSLRHLVDPTPSVLVLLDATDEDHLDAARGLGADGYLVANRLTRAGLDTAISAVLRGQFAMPSMMAKAVLSRREHGNRDQSLFFLTSREQEVLGLLSEGCSNKEIARMLGISPHGVKHHVTNVLAKLHCSTRTAAVVVATREGLLKTG